MSSGALLRRAAAGLALAALALAAGVFIASEVRLSRRYPTDVAPVRIPTDAASLETGRHLVEVVGQCTTCHGDDLSGRSLADSFSLGRLDAPNLTPGRGGIGQLADVDLVRSIRHGVKPDGRPVLMMPSNSFARFRDSELGALIAYLRSLPAVDRERGGTRLGPLSRIVMVVGAAPDLLPAEILANRKPPESPPPGPNSAYGEVLVATAGCTVCHRPNLAGGRHPLALPGEPPPPDLTPSGALASWSERDFMDTLRRGVTPDGRTMDARFMPWPRIGRMSDVELQAIWRHLKSIPATRPARSESA